MKARNDEDFPSRNVFARLGFKQQLATKILLHCEGPVDYEDIAAPCQPIAASSNLPAQDVSEAVIGFVYLMKSGGYYKLGLSNCGATLQDGENMSFQFRCLKNSQQFTLFVPMIR